MSAAVLVAGWLAFVASSLNLRAPQSRICLRASVAASNWPRPPVLVCWLPNVPLASVVRSVSTYGVMVTEVSGTPSVSAVIIIISVRWPSPMSLLAEMHCTVPSLLMTTWPDAGLPPAPWLQACAAMPMPW